MMNMRHLAMMAVACTLFFSALPAQAGPSQDECAIWLCMPGGFPGSECSSPHKAMIKRIKKGKSPVPSLPSCFVDGSATPPGLPGGDVSTKEGNTAYYFNRVKCTRENHDGQCIGFKNLPNKFVMNSWCKKESYTEAYRSQCKSIRHIETIVDGQSFGTPLFYDKDGNTYDLK